MFHSSRREEEFASFEGFIPATPELVSVFLSLFYSTLIA